MPQVLQINIPKLTAAITSALMPPDAGKGVKKAVGKTAAKLANAVSGELQPIFAAMNQSIESNISIADDLTDKIEKLEAASASASAGATPGV
jgi:hypothetical protein